MTYTVKTFEGVTFPHCTIADVIELMGMSEHCTLTNEQAFAAPVSAHIAAHVAAPVAAPVSVPSFVAIDKRERRTLPRLDAAYVAHKYGMQRTNQRVNVTFEGEKDAARVLYRHIASGMPFAIVHGRFVACRECDVMPAPAPVAVSRTIPDDTVSPVAAPVAAPVRVPSFACFYDGQTPLIRKVRFDVVTGEKLVTYKHETLTTVDLCAKYGTVCVYKQERAEKWLEKARRQTRATKSIDKETRKRAQKNAIPSEYRGVQVVVSDAHKRTIAWTRAAELVDALISAGIAPQIIELDGKMAFARHNLLGNTRTYREVLQGNAQGFTYTSKRGGAWFCYNA